MGDLAEESMPLPATGATSPRVGVSFSAEPVVLPKVAPTASSGVPPDAHDVIARTRFTWNTEDTFDSALTPAQLLCIMERAPRAIPSAKCVYSANVYNKSTCAVQGNHVRHSQSWRQKLSDEENRVLNIPNKVPRRHPLPGAASTEVAGSPCRIIGAFASGVVWNTTAWVRRSASVMGR